MSTFVESILRQGYVAARLHQAEVEVRSRELLAAAAEPPREPAAVVPPTNVTPLAVARRDK